MSGSRPTAAFDIREISRTEGPASTFDWFDEMARSPLTSRADCCCPGLLARVWTCGLRENSCLFVAGWFSAATIV
jgi:hypothetical protein